MLNRTVSILVGVALILIVGISVYVHKQSKVFVPPVTQTATSTAPAATTTPKQTKPSTAKPVTTPKPTIPTPAPTGITMAQVAQHNSRESCWAAINGSVYDLTSWIPNHPGGEQRILRICGTDGSDEYNGQHGKSSRPAMILAGFKLDVLAQ